MTGCTTHKLRPSPYLLQVTSQTLFFPVQNYSPHTFHSERTPESHNLTPFDKFDRDMGGGDGSIGMGVEVWRLVVLAILMLLLKQLPIMIATYRWIPDVKIWREAVFSGHFRPMGIGGIFISTLVNDFLCNFVAHNPSPTSSSFDDQRHQIEVIRVIVQLLVAFMVLVFYHTIHGLSIPVGLV